MMRSLTFTALLATAILASPAPGGYGFCATVNSKISAGNEQKAATAYCSSYLSIPVYTTKACRTKTITKTTGGKTSTITAPEVTSTITSTSTSAISTASFSTTTTITDVSTETPSTTIYECQVPFAAPDNRKRAVQEYKVQKPKCFSDYTSKKAKSSACSCVSVQPSTTTIVDSTVTKTVTKQKRSTRTITPTKLVTSIVTTTIVASTTTTYTENVSSTTTSSTTATINSVRPHDIFAIGAYKPGNAYNGYYLHADYNFATTNPAVFVEQYRNGGLTEMHINDAGNLVDIHDFYDQHRGGVDPSSPYDDPQRITFAHSGRLTDTDIAIGNLPCTIEVKDDYMCYLHCSLGDNKTNYICADGSWYIGLADEEPKDGCETFTPLVAGVPYQK